jgi:uncharacterized membrane protein YkvA (DUF1232 family)
MDTNEDEARLEKRYDDFYQKLRKRMRHWVESTGQDHRWAELLMIAPDIFHLMVCLVFDKDVPQREKTKLFAAIAYFFSPLDLLPELLLGPIAFIDDIALACFVINSMLSSVDTDVIRKHWAGEGDILELVEVVAAKGDEWLGTGLWKRVRQYIARRK